MKLKYIIIFPNLIFYSLLSIGSPDCNDLRSAQTALRQQTQLEFGKSAPAEFAKIGKPDEKIASGVIYRWHRNGYVLEIMPKNSNGSSIGIIGSSESQNQKKPPEFDTIYNSRDEPQLTAALAKANELLGSKDREKIDLTSYIWHCTANDVLKINGKSIPVTQSLEITVDPNNKIIQIIIS